MTKCVIMRGIPGCGKSTWAEMQCQINSGFICSADQHFLQKVPNAAGEMVTEYQFDVGKLPAAHARCFNQFLLAIKRGESTVFVDNTNIRIWEFSNYIEVAMMMGCQVQVVEVRLPGVPLALACCRRCRHRVPLERIAEMERAFERFEGATIVPPKFSMEDMRSYVHDLKRLFPWKDFSAEEVLSWFPKEAIA